MWAPAILQAQADFQVAVQTSVVWGGGGRTAQKRHISGRAFPCVGGADIGVQGNLDAFFLDGTLIVPIDTPQGCYFRDRNP